MPHRLARALICYIQALGLPEYRNFVITNLNNKRAYTLVPERKLSKECLNNEGVINKQSHKDDVTGESEIVKLG